jgi:hypothetical protein
MAISFVGGATAGKAGATSGDSTIALDSGLTGGIGTAVAAGDFVIAVFGTGSNTDRGTLAITDGTIDYELIGAELFSSDSWDANLRVAYKFMGETPDASTTFGPTLDAADAGAMAVRVYRGVDPTTPLDVAAVQATGTDTAQADPPAITPVTDGAVIVCVGAGGHSRGSAGSYSSSDLTAFQVQSANDSNDAVIGVGHKTDWTSGEFDAAAFTFSGGAGDGTSYSWCATTLALRPAAGAGNVTVTPDTKALTTATFAPTVTASDHKTVTPGTAALTLSTFAPTVTASDNQTVTPSTAALTLETFAPTVSTTDHKTVTPGTAALTLTTFEPTVTGGAGLTLTPGTASLILTTFAPTVTATTTTAPEVEAPHIGGKGDNAGRGGIFKPTGLDYRQRKQRKAPVAVRVEEAREVAAEVTADAQREFVMPIALMSLAEVDREIGMLLRKAVRTEEDDVMLLTLMAAAAA